MNKLFVMMMVVVCCVLSGTHYASAEGEDGWTDPLPVCAMGERTTWMGCYPYPDDMFTGMVLNPECGTDPIGTLGCAYNVLKMAAATSGLPTPHGVAYVPADVVPVAEYWCDIDGDGLGGIYFCASAEMIYVGAAMYDQYYEYSPAFPYVMLAHEYGHFLQQVYRTPVPTLNESTRMVELQADCFAGVLVQAYHAAGVLTDGDIDDIYDMYLQWGNDRDVTSGDHGTSEERTEAFTTGYNDTTTSACNLSNMFS